MLSAMSLGDQIRRARLKKELSQSAIAKVFEISRAAVAQWENGTTRPDQGKLVELASILGIGLDDLLADGGAPNDTQPRNAAPDRDLLDAWEHLLPRERDALLTEIKQKAAHNMEAANHFKPKVFRAVDLRKRQVHFDGPDRRQQKEDSDAQDA